MIEKITFLLKKFLMVKYTNDGAFYLYFKIPFKIKTSFLYKLLYARHPVIQNKIIFDNYMGLGYGCNPKYVTQKILEKYPGKFDIVWVISKKEGKFETFPDGVRVVFYNSPEARKEYATAKVWVSNYHKIAYVKKGMFKKEEQYFIQMWHGSLGIKRIENDATVLTSDLNWLKLAKLSSSMVDYWISNSKFETEIYRNAFWNVKNVLEYGHPRNDLLFGDTKNVKKKVEDYYGIQKKRILLYAPTFREDYRLDCYKIDFRNLKEKLEIKFGGEWVVLVRLHSRVREYSTKVIPSENYIIDISGYSDIQELIAAADCMITDYSSCVFDFMLTYRPAFIFAIDKTDYVSERGFYYLLEETPFPIACDNQELGQNILDFDNRIYAENINAFLEDKGCVDDGHASERVADLIMQLTTRKD